MSEVSKLVTEDTFREVADLLFGGGADELVSKMNPTPSDVATHDKRKRALTAGLSAIGATAGAAGLGYAGMKTGGAYRAARAVKGTGRLKALGTAVKHEKVGAALLPLEVAGLGGEVMATRILHGDTKRRSTRPGAVTKADGTTPTNQQRKKAVYRTAMAGNTIALVGGSHALGMSLGSEHLPGGKYVKRGMGALESGAKKLTGGATTKLGATKTGGKLIRAAKNPKMAAGIATAGAAGWVGLHGAELSSDLYANRTIRRDYRRTGMPSSEPNSIGKGLEPHEQASFPTSKAGLTMAIARNPKVQQKALATTRKARGKFREAQIPGDLPSKVVSTPIPSQVEKVWEGEFAKIDDEKQQVFGWASVIEVNGEPVVDLQGDYISPEEMEKAGYSYVMKSRKGGDMHLRDNWEPIQKSEMIESFIVTDEKRQAMGLPPSVPTGWWVGFKVQDEDLWRDIKEGRRTGFSIHGTGKRSPAEAYR